MAGIAKPNLPDLNDEMTEYQLIKSYNTNSPYGYGTGAALFDEKIHSYPYQNKHVFSLNYKEDYLVVRVDKRCNVYRIGTDFNQNGSLRISPSTYKKVNVVTSNGWELYIEGLEPGTYTFTNNGAYRSDSEWFFEEVPLHDASTVIKKRVLEAIKNSIDGKTINFEIMEE